MRKPKLTYFDAPVSRGEECRLALHVGGVDFEDHRVKHAEWAALKPTTPFGALPVFELPGQAPLAQSNAILTLIGRRHGLHPKDDVEAARQEAMMEHIEEARIRLSVTMRMDDLEAKKAAREALAATYLPSWAAGAESQCAADGPFFGGNAIQVVDFKIFVMLRWLRSGVIDHVPATIFASYAKLNRVHDAVETHPRVKDWYATKR